MKESKFIVGLIGALADISAAHLDAIQSHPDFTLKSVCDLKEQKLVKKYHSFKNLNLSTDYKTLLEDQEINTIVICTPNHLHATIAMDALKSNKNVLCEKPMTISPAQSNEILKTMHDSLGVMVVSYHFEFFPEVQHLSRELNSFGKIKRFRFESSEYLSPIPGKEWNYEKGNGGVWLDWAPNALSVLRKIIAVDKHFRSYRILDAKLDTALGLAIETNAEVKLSLDRVKGEFAIDWEAAPEIFIAQTTFWDGLESQKIVE